MTPRTYASPESFKQALEQRLRVSAKTGAEFARKRQLLVFDRFLARIVAVLGDAATLKGGLVLELRIERARTTKDVDLRMVGSPDDVLAKLQEAGRKNLSDFMTFEVVPDDDHPEIQNDGMQYDGLRFRAECKLAGKVYGQPFGVDVTFGDPILGEPEVVVADDVLAFAFTSRLGEGQGRLGPVYRQKGTAQGIRNAVRFFLGIDIVAITAFNANTLVLGEPLLGVDWVLGPSDRFARYAFNIVVARILSATERKRLRAIVEYLKPAHTHFVDLVEPFPPVIPDHWELGLSDLGETSELH